MKIEILVVRQSLEREGRKIFIMAFKFRGQSPGSLTPRVRMKMYGKAPATLGKS